MTASGAVETLGEQLCGKASLTAPAPGARQNGVFAGLGASSAAGPTRGGAKSEASFVVVCENGVVAKVVAGAQAPAATTGAPE